MGSITSWVRLEPRCRDEDLREAPQARIRDPLWLLARQWQMAEFRGEDAGSPVLARWRGHSTRLTRWHPGAIDPQDRRTAGLPYDVGAMPLEALVERRPAPAAIDQGPGGAHAGSSLRLAAEAGLHFLRMLDAQSTSRGYRAEVIQAFALAAPAAAEAAALDAESLAYVRLMAGRVPDARRLQAALRAAPGERPPLTDTLGVAAADRAEVEQVAAAWLRQCEALFLAPPAGTDAWDAERLEYAFSIGAAFGDEEATLTATEYADGHLDWHSVDLDRGIGLGAAADRAQAPVVCTVMPAPVSFRGAPAQRFWECEDASIDYGLLPAGPGDLPHLMLSDFASNFGSDWYVIGIDLGVGTLTRSRSLVATDSFGVRTLIRPVNDPAAPAPGWSMYALSSVQRSAAAPAAPEPNLLFLAPALPRILESRPTEEVLFLRDEMANMAWAVEKVLAGPLEQRIEAGAAATPGSPAMPAAPLSPGVSSESEVPGAAEPAPGPGLPRYRLATEVPPNWTPLLPQRPPEGGALRLVAAAVLAADGTNVLRPPRSALLKALAGRSLFDQEVPREGARVTQHFEHARWTDGSDLLWVALRKRVGSGEGSSNLRFDEAQDPP